MATSTLIQYLESATSEVSHRSEVETFLAGGAITAGDWVSLDTSQSGLDRALYVTEAAAVATVGNANVIGVALETVAAGANVRVCTAGYCASASVAGATVAGSSLVGPTGVAGQAAIEVPGTTSGKVCGVGLGAAVANLAPVLVVKTF
jgi:hypothetical protein